jgi:hypothetical protein
MLHYEFKDLIWQGCQSWHGALIKELCEQGCCLRRTSVWFADTNDESAMEAECSVQQLVEGVKGVTP